MAMNDDDAAAAVDDDKKKAKIHTKYSVAVLLPLHALMINSTSVD